jgi:hypothetical protein
MVPRSNPKFAKETLNLLRKSRWRKPDVDLHSVRRVRIQLTERGRRQKICNLVGMLSAFGCQMRNSICLLWLEPIALHGNAEQETEQIDVVRKFIRSLGHCLQPHIDGT